MWWLYCILRSVVWCEPCWRLWLPPHALITHEYNIRLRLTTTVPDTLLVCYWRLITHFICLSGRRTVTVLLRVSIPGWHSVPFGLYAAVTWRLKVNYLIAFPAISNYCRDYSQALYCDWGKRQLSAGFLTNRGAGGLYHQQPPPPHPAPTSRPIHLPIHSISSGADQSLPLSLPPIPALVGETWKAGGGGRGGEESYSITETRNTNKTGARILPVSPEPRPTHTARFSHNPPEAENRLRSYFAQSLLATLAFFPALMSCRAPRSGIFREALT